MTIDSVKRVKELLHIDLTEPEKGDPPLLTRLGTEMILLCDMLYVMVKPQADALGVTGEQFAAALDGAAAFNAQNAFYEEFVDFFQKCGRKDRATAASKQQRMIALAVNKSNLRLEAIDEESKLNEIYGEPSIS